MTFAFTASNIVARSLKVSKRGALDQATVVEVVYTDTTTTPWSEKSVFAKFPGVDTGAVPRRLSRVYKPGLTRYSEANREAIETLNDSTLCDTIVTLGGFDDALAVRVGEVVTVTHPIGFAAKPFRVKRRDSAGPGRYSFTLQEYDPAAYSDVVVTAPTIPDTILTSPANPPAVSGLAVTEDVYQVQTGRFESRLRLSWTDATAVFPFVDGYQITISQAGQLVQGPVLAPRGAIEFVTHSMAEGLLYACTVQVISTSGAVGAAATATITNNGKLAIPSDVPSISGFEVGGEVRLTWTPATDLDLTAHEIRYSVTGGSWASATLLDRIAAPSVRYTTKQVPSGTWRFWIKGLDSVRTDTYPYGQESANAAWCDITVTQDASILNAGTHTFTAPTLSNMTAFGVPGPNGWVTTYITDAGDGIGYGTDNPTNTTGTFADSLNNTPFAVPTSASACSCSTEAWDVGSPIASTVTTPLAVTALQGDFVIEIGYSTDGTNYAWAAGTSARGTGRYWKVRVSGGPGDVFAFDASLLQLSMAAVLREETGSLAVAASGFSTVVLTSKYGVFQSIQLTAQGSTATSVAFDDVQVNPLASSALQMSTTHNGGGVSNAFTFMQISASTRVVLSDDFLEYDVLIVPNSSSYAGVGGIDVSCSDTTNLRDATPTSTTDGGLSHNSDLTAFAVGVWWSRRIPMSSLVGKTANAWNLVTGVDADGTYVSLYRNVRVTNGASTTRQTIYSGGAPSTRSVFMSAFAINMGVNQANAFDVYLFDPTTGSRVAGTVAYQFKGA